MTDIDYMMREMDRVTALAKDLGAAAQKALDQRDKEIALSNKLAELLRARAPKINQYEKDALAEHKKARAK